MRYQTCDSNFQYFYFNNIPYRTGTVVKFQETYVNTHYYNNQPIGMYAYFLHRIELNGMSAYMFSWHPSSSNKTAGQYAGYFTISEEDMLIAIDEIIKPVEIIIVPQTKKSDIESPEVIAGWLTLIVVLFFSFIFTEWYLIWIWALVIFFIWRNKKLWE